MIQKVDFEMIQVLLNDLIRMFSPFSNILLNIQIPPPQLIRFSCPLANLVFNPRGTRCEEKTGVSCQFGLMVESVGELCDAVCCAGFDQIAFWCHQLFD